MMRGGVFRIVLLLLLLVVPFVVLSSPVETRGVEVVFRVDDKVVKGPSEITLKSGGRRAQVQVRDDIPTFDPVPPPQARVVVLPDWAMSADGTIMVSLAAKFKGRILHFERVKLWQGMGRLTFLVDRPPFNDDVEYALGTKGRRTEAHALFLEPVHGDGYIMAYLAGASR